MKKSVFNLAATITIGIGLLALSGCSTAKDQLGLSKKKPDEFAVIQRAPLELPPDYSLRPPRPGTPRPQEQADLSAPRQAVFGQEEQSRATPASGETALLRQAGAGSSEAGIRETVDRESQALEPKDKPVADRFLGVIGLGGNDADQAPTSIVDAEAEAERIRANNANGAPITQGETPTKEN